MAEGKTVTNNWQGANITNYGTLTGDIVNPQYTFYNNKATQEEILQKLRGAIHELKEQNYLVDDVQWYAVMRYLQDRYLAPTKKEAWLAFLTKYVGEEVPSYENYRKPPTERLIPHSATWITIVSPTDAEDKQILIVKKLQELL